MGREKNTFSVRRSVVWSIWGVILLLVSVVHADSPGESFVEALKNNAVQITASREDREENGFGFIIGENRKQVFIVTANHVVRGDQGPEPMTINVTVRYFTDQGKGYTAKVLETSDAKLDLAILQVSRPDGELPWQREALSADMRVETQAPVWFIGLLGKWYVPSVPGSVNRYDYNPNSILNIYVDGLDVFPGTSGAPLISKGGIIGMLIDDKSRGHTQALPIETIQSKVKGWGYPWQLTAYAAVRSFYIEHDSNSKNIAKYLQEQMVKEGLNISNNKDKSGHNTITISIKSKINKTSVYANKIAKLATDIVIKDRSNKPVFRESFLTNGSSDDNYNDAIDDASYILVSQLGDERVIYEVFEQIK